MIHWAWLIVAFVLGAAAVIAVMCFILYGINKVAEWERKQAEDM